MEKWRLEEARRIIRDVGLGPAVDGVFDLDDFDHDGRPKDSDVIEFDNEQEVRDDT